MINVTRLDHSSFVLNSDLIEFIENTPDTVITLTDHRKITVLESAAEVVDLTRAWRRSLLATNFMGTQVELKNAELSTRENS